MGIIGVAGGLTVGARCDVGGRTTGRYWLP